MIFDRVRVEIIVVLCQTSSTECVLVSGGRCVRTIDTMLTQLQTMLVIDKPPQVFSTRPGRVWRAPEHARLLN